VRKDSTLPHSPRKTNWFARERKSLWDICPTAKKLIRKGVICEAAGSFQKETGRKTAGKEAMVIRDSCRRTASIIGGVSVRREKN